MTERTDLATLLSVSGEPSPLSLPSPPAPDLEAMASLLKKELEQMEDYFLEESLSPDQVAPSTPPSTGNFHFPFGDGFQPLDQLHFVTSKHQFRRSWEHICKEYSNPV